MYEYITFILQGTNLDSIVDKNEFVVTVGDQRCKVTGTPSDNSGLVRNSLFLQLGCFIFANCLSFSPSQLCVPPLEPPGGDNMPRVMVSQCTYTCICMNMSLIKFVLNSCTYYVVI